MEVLVGESTPASSYEQLIVPITTTSSVSASISKYSMAASNSSSSCAYGPEKAFIMQLAKDPFDISTSGDVIAGPSSSAPVGVADVPLVPAATDTDSGCGFLYDPLSNVTYFVLVVND
ncbi:hypothetical protein [Candidatus Ichthyocystis sparus]|uniref:hypothetical protein n=1 Tax=Candidatus Ichthyocystis sparus TaxID=1561004 RepID=UPI000B81E4F0|nr:hypothetical protein [Candidatus Ichthyocystis sparus]